MSVKTNKEREAGGGKAVLVVDLTESFPEVAQGNLRGHLRGCPCRDLDLAPSEV